MRGAYVIKKDTKNKYIKGGIESGATCHGREKTKITQTLFLFFFLLTKKMKLKANNNALVKISGKVNQ